MTAKKLVVPFIVTAALGLALAVIPQALQGDGRAEPHLVTTASGASDDKMDW